MFGSLLNLATLDALDWFAVIAACVAGAALTLQAFSGLNLFQPRSSLSPLEMVTVTSMLVFAGVFAADQYWPVRTMLYLVNADPLPLMISAGEYKGCLLPKSYNVLSWRWDPPKEFEVSDPRSHASVKLPVGAGTWVVNPSKTKVSADFISPEGLEQDTMLVGDRNLLKVNVGSGKIYRMFSGNPIDRVYSPEGDIVAKDMPETCDPNQR